MNNISESVDKLHKNPVKIYIVATGAGAGIQSLLTRIPGASHTLIGCEFPYSCEALNDFLGYNVNHSACAPVSGHLAKKAFEKGKTLAKENEMVIGLGITGALATDRVLKGEHRVHFAIYDGENEYYAYIQFEKDAVGRSVIGRSGESYRADLFGLNMLLYYLRMEQLPIISDGIVAEKSNVSILNNKTVTLLPLKNKEHLQRPLSTLSMPDGMYKSPDSLSPDEYILFPGTFNPLHNGHKHIAEIAANHINKSVVFMINSYHPDKKEINYTELIDQFSWYAPLLITNGLNLYIEKARKFPKFTFLMGTDTLERMLDQKYYDFPIKDMLDEFFQLKTHFLVARRPIDGKIKTMEEVFNSNPQVVNYASFGNLKYLFTELLTNINMSSTELRHKRDIV